MTAYKDSRRNTWYAKFRYTDWQGNRRETTRRGFSTKREAKEFEEEFKRKAQSNPTMTFQSLYDIYLEDMQQHNKETSIVSIDNSIKRHVLPMLGSIPIAEITPNVIRKWQNYLTSYSNYCAISVVKLWSQHIEKSHKPLCFRCLRLYFQGTSLSLSL